MNTVDNRIVNLQFNNKDFEKNAATSMKTCDELEKKLTFKGIGEGLKNLTGWFNNVQGMFKSLTGSASGILKPIEEGTMAAAKSFNPLREIAIGALRDIGVEAKNTAKNLMESLSIEQVKAGYSKFDEKTRSVQTIMSATGYSIEKVNKQLEKLNWYTDETSYAYTDMTNSIGKFTNAGVKLEDAVTAMIGIGNAAGLAGASVQDASHAMAGFGKAMGQGYMDLQSWNWIQTAHMDTVGFKKELIAASEQLGYIEKGAVTLDTFESTLGKDKWLKNDAMTMALKKYGTTTEKIYDYIQKNGGYTSDAIDAIGISMEDLGLKAFKASQEAKTFSDALDSVKDAVSTGWMTSFEIIIGNYEQAKIVWTDLANWLYDVVAESGNTRNELLKEWRDKWTFGLNELGGRAYLLEALYEIFDTLAEYIYKVGDAFKTVFGEDWDADLLYSLTQGIHDFAQVFAATVENGVFDYETKGTIVWFQRNIEQLFYIVKDFTEVIKFLGNTFSTILHQALGFTDLLGEMKVGWDETGVAIEDNATKLGKILFKALHTVNSFIRKTFLSNEAKDRIRTIALQVGNIVSTLRDIIVSAANSVTRALKIVFGSFGGFSFSTISTVLNMVQFIADIIYNVVASVSSFSKETNLTTIVTAVLTGLKSAVSIISSLIRAISPVIRTFLPIFMSYVSALANIFERLVGGNVLEMVIAFIENLPITLAPLEAIMRSVLEVARPFITALTDLINLIAKLATVAITYIGQFARALQQKLLDTDLFKIFNQRVKDFGDALSRLFGVLTGKGDEIISELGEYSKVDGEESFGWIDFLVDAVSNAVTFLTNALPTITSLVDQFTGMISSIQTSMTNSATDKDGKSLFTVLNYNMRHLFDGVDHDDLKTDAAAYSRSTFSGLIEGISKALQDANINWDTVKPIAGFLAFLSMIVIANKTLLSLDDLLENLQKVPTTLGELIINFNGIFKNISECIETINASIKELTIIQKIKAVAIALAILAASVWVLAQLPRDALARGLVALGLIAVILGVMMKIMKDLGTTFGGNTTTNMTNSGNTNVLSGNVTTINAGLFGAAMAILSLAAFVLVLMAAFEKLKDINTDDMVKVGVTLGGMLILVGAILAVLAHLGKSLKNTSETEANLANGTNKKNKIESTSSYFATLALAIGSLALAIMAIASSINSMALVANKVGSIDFAQAVGTFVVITVFMTGMIAALAGIEAMATDTYKIPNMARRLLTAATAMTIIALAINIATVPILALAAASKAGVDLKTVMWEAFLPLVAIMAFIPLVLAVSEKIANGGSLIKAATSLLIFAVALNLILLPLAALGILTHAAENDLAGAFVALAVIISALCGAMIVMGASAALIPNTTSMTWVAKAIAVFASSVLVIAGSMALLKYVGLDGDEVVKMGTVFGILITVISVLLFGMTALFTKLHVSVSEVMSIASSVVMMSLSFVLVAGALAILNNYCQGIDMINLMDKITWLVTIIGAIAAGLAIVGLFVPGMPAIISALASAISSVGTVLIGLALVVASFGLSLYLLGKAMPAISEAMPRFVESINLLGEGLEKHESVMVLATIIIVALTAGVVALMLVLASALPTIGAGIQGFITSLSGMSFTAKAAAGSLILGIAIGLAEATPEVLVIIEDIFDLVMARLGMVMGWLVDGLLKLTIELLYGLADAIRNNSGAITYALWDICEAIGELLLDVLGSSFGLAIQATWAMLDAAKDAIKYAWEHGEDIDASFTELFDKNFKSRMNNMNKFTKDFKENMRSGMSELAEVLDISDVAPALKVNEMPESESLWNQFTEKIFGDTESAKAKAKQKASDAATDIVGSLTDTLKNAINIDDLGGIEGIMGRLTGGESISQGDWTKILSLDGLNIDQLRDELYDNMNFVSTDNIASFNAASLAFGDYTVQVGDGTESMNKAFLGLNETVGDSTGQMVEDLSQSGEDAEIKMGEGMDGLLGTVNSRQSDFYKAGEDLIRNLQSGVDNTWYDVAENVKSKFRQLADDLKNIMSKDNIYGDITPVINSDNPYQYFIDSTPSWIKTDSITAAASKTATDVEKTTEISDETAKTNSLLQHTLDELASIKESNAKFHDDFDAFKADQAGKVWVMDTGAVVGELKAPLFGEFSGFMSYEKRGNMR